MNTNQINNRKAAFVQAMENDEYDIHHAVAPAELMAILHHCDPLKYNYGVDILINSDYVNEDVLLEYMDDKHCWEHDWEAALNTFLMDPVRAKLNKYKYEKALLADDEILAFALFLVGDSLIVKEADEDEDIDYSDTADLVNHVAQRLKFLLMCMNLGRYDVLNTVIQFARSEMKTPIDTTFCFDTFEPNDGGVMNYFKVMTDHIEYGKRYDEWMNEIHKRIEDEKKQKEVNALKAQVKKLTEKPKDPPFDHFGIKQDEPLVERDFEG